ncbi:MAG: tetratricopeptide repeat protein [Planctomycetia bacterium]|jgi:tetratricopeptide (TPR) repeat protein
MRYKHTKTLLTLVFVMAALSAATFYGCSKPVDYQRMAAVDEAQKAFEVAKTPEDFLKVAGRYQQILDSGVRSWAIFYNQGNAMMEAGQRGRAIAAYRQAQQLHPNNAYLKANLQYALGQDVSVEPPRTIVGHILFWQNWIGYPTKLHLAVIVGIVTFLLGIVALFYRSKLLGRIAAAFVLITLILSFSAAYDWYRFDHIEHGVVVANDTVARKGNAESYDPSFTEPLSDGTEFTLLSRRGNWLQIHLPGEQEGCWIPTKDAVVY